MLFYLVRKATVKFTQGNSIYPDGICLKASLSNTASNSQIGVFPINKDTYGRSMVIQGQLLQELHRETNDNTSFVNSRGLWNMWLNVRLQRKTHVAGKVILELMLSPVHGHNAIEAIKTLYGENAKFVLRFDSAAGDSQTILSGCETGAAKISIDQKKDMPAIKWTIALDGTIEQLRQLYNDSHQQSQKGATARVSVVVQIPDRLAGIQMTSSDEWLKNAYKSGFASDLMATTDSGAEFAVHKIVMAQAPLIRMLLEQEEQTKEQHASNQDIEESHEENMQKGLHDISKEVDSLQQTQTSVIEEQQQKTSEEKLITVLDGKLRFRVVSEKVLQHVLDALYQQKVNISSMQNKDVLGVLTLAKILKIPTLEQAAIQFLLEQESKWFELPICFTLVKSLDDMDQELLKKLAKVIATHPDTKQKKEYLDNLVKSDISLYVKITEMMVC